MKIGKDDRLKKLIIGIVILLLIGGGVYLFINMKKEENHVLKEVENQIPLEYYAIYGTSLNLKGTLTNTTKEHLFTLVAKSDLEEKNVPITLNWKENNVTFTTNTKINNGFSLESISDGTYYLLLKEEKTDGSIVYYSLENKTKYTDLTYYTMTKQQKNQKIDFNFGTYQQEKKELPYLQLKAQTTTLPQDVYDVVIDPGHGGIDPGAVNGDDYESNIALDYAKNLKTELEKLGLKVKMTRDSDIDLNAYGTHGRASIPNEVKAKYVISLHLNSIDTPNGQDGFEVYAPTNADLTLATSFAKEIANGTSIDYSGNTNARQERGVYVRNMTTWDIEETNQDAIDHNYKPYETLSKDTPYLYIIRETGGISTKAYVDGRNPEYDKNPYYDSNIGVEGYLIELGYINHDRELPVLLQEKTNYVKAIAKAFSIVLEKN